MRVAEGGAGAVRGAVRGAGMGRRAGPRRGQGRGVRMCGGGGIPRAARTVVCDEIHATFCCFFLNGMCFMDIFFTVSITVNVFSFFLKQVITCYPIHAVLSCFFH